MSPETYMTVAKKLQSEAGPCPMCGAANPSAKGITQSGHVFWRIECKNCIYMLPPHDWPKKEVENAN